MAEAFPMRRLLGRSYFAPGRAPITASDHLLNGRDISSHDHDFMEIAIVLGGAGVHRSLAGDQPLGRGDALVLRPGVWHAYENCRSLRVYNCIFAPELLGRELAWMRDDPVLAHLLWSGPLGLDSRGIISVKLPGAALTKCGAILDTIRASDQRPALVAHLILLLGELARALARVKRAGSAVVKAAIALHPAIADGIRLMEADPSHPWMLGELAQRLQHEKSYLVRLFRRHTGLSPMAYLARLRVERAAALLLRTEDPVSRIAARVGYPDANYFARRFRARFGATASDFRTKMRRP